jgi:Fe-S-cluster containining protein
MQCGDCCTGATGYVWVNNREIAALAAEIGEGEVAEFERRYVRAVGIRKSLKELPNGDCVFFHRPSRCCQVYAGRPRQCRSWPFWESNLRTPADWARTCQACPGSGAGPTHNLREIDKQRRTIAI